MIYRIIKNMTCPSTPDPSQDSQLCSVKIKDKLQTMGLDIDGKPQDSYVDIIHKPNNHYIIVVIYDKDQHERISGSEMTNFHKTGQIRKDPDEIITRAALGSKAHFKKRVGNIPTKVQIEAIL